MKFSMMAGLLALGLTLAGLPAQAHDRGHIRYRHLPTVSKLPAGVIQISPVVPGMGAHYARPQDLPLGPIYCVYKGRIVCLEFMISQKDFKAGKSWPDLHADMKGLPPVDHVNIGFQPHGHEGFEVPHYDIHMYFLPPKVIARIK
ncbi:MAG: hypothetical protein KDG89_11195 [Geminicoccaceae bacterium]|nr:hypothetical protein [Geminicoccaceae bacterium]